MKIGIVNPARNEETFLGKTLQCLLSQTLKPSIIVVVDDGSTDKTVEIARKCEAFVVHLPNRGYSAAGMPELADVLNEGFRTLDKVAEFDYVMVLGADHPLPLTYTEEMVARMEKDRRIVMASGRRLGGPFSSEIPNPSGRIYRFKFMREIGFFPVNYGWETYPILKALMMGYKVKSFDDIVTLQQRPLRVSVEKMYFWGKGMKALGYDSLYTLGRCVSWFFKSPKASINMLRGYLSSGVREYSDLSNFTGRWQRRIILKRIEELPRFWKWS